MSRLRAHRRLVLAGLAVLLLAGASGGAWLVAVQRMQAALTAWETAQRARGWSIAHGPAERGGWPLAAELALPDLAVSGTGVPIPGGVAWTARRLTLRVGLAEAGQAVAQVIGPQTLRVGPGMPVAFTAAQFALAVPLADPAGPVTLSAEDLRLEAGGAVALLHAEATRPAAGAAAALQVSAQSITLPPGRTAQLGLGERIASLAGEAVVSGTWPATASSPAEIAAAWRQSQGMVELHRVAVGWGPLGVSGSATLALDAALQPAGSAKLHVVGYEPALAALAGAQAITADAARAARAVLSLLANEPVEGEPASVDLTVGLKDRTLTAGHFPLVRIPELVWPAAPASASVPP